MKEISDVFINDQMIWFLSPEYKEGLVARSHYNNSFIHSFILMMCVQDQYCVIMQIFIQALKVCLDAVQTVCVCLFVLFVCDPKNKPSQATCSYLLKEKKTLGWSEDFFKPFKMKQTYFVNININTL